MKTRLTKCPTIGGIPMQRIAEIELKKEVDFRELMVAIRRAMSDAKGNRLVVEVWVEAELGFGNLEEDTRNVNQIRQTDSSP